MGDTGRLTAEARKQLEELTGSLGNDFGDDLLSVVLHGSAARGDHLGGGSSDLNVVVVLQDISLASLERGTRSARAWLERGNRSLLFFSPEWIARSCDVFPLEFLDILEAHVVLHGADPFAGLQVSRDSLRLQCEGELKTKLIHLRTGYVELHEDTEGLAKLLAASYAPVVALCRGALRISGQTVPARAEDVVRSVAALFGLDAGPFAEVAAIKQGGPGAASLAAKPLFRRYYAQVEALARAADSGFPKGANR